MLETFPFYTCVCLITLADNQDAEEESKAEAVAIYHVGSQSQGDDGTMSRSFESSIDGYEVNGEISFRVGGDGNEAKAMSEKQELRIVFGSGQAPSVLESILRKATPGWRAEVEEMALFSDLYCSQTNSIYGYLLSLSLSPSHAHTHTRAREKKREKRKERIPKDR